MVIEEHGLVAAAWQVVVGCERLELQPRQVECVGRVLVRRQLPGLGLVYGAEAAEVDGRAELRRHLRLVDALYIRGGEVGDEVAGVAAVYVLRHAVLVQVQHRVRAREGLLYATPHSILLLLGLGSALVDVEDARDDQLDLVQV